MTGEPSHGAVWVDGYAQLASRVLAAPPRLGPVRMVGVDGPAGSGKTTFAARLTSALAAAGADVEQVHTDDLLAGWADITSFWARLEQWILAPLRNARPGSYRAYDWHAGQFNPQWRPVPVPDVLVLDGVSSTRLAIRSELSLAVFVQADPQLRLARGLARDGAALRPQWLRWMADEAAHFVADHAADHADLLVDGAPRQPDRPDEFVVTGGRLAAAAGLSGEGRREKGRAGDER
jgi:hypothetical protein